MNANLKVLHNIGQSIWVDNISRELLVNGSNRDLLASERWEKLASAGAKPQRLLWASTGTKDPAASDTLHVEALSGSDA